MKRTIALILSLTMLLCLPAYAAGNLEVNEDNWYVVSHSDDYRVYYFAAAKNGTDKTVSVNDLLFQIQDAEGDTVESTSKYNMYPQVLQPGETGWLVISKDGKDLNSKSDIDHYTLTITTKVNDDQLAHPLTAECEYIEKDEDDNEDVLRATVTNQTAENAFDITVAMLARDAEGKLLYITGDTAKNIGLPAASSLMERASIKSDIMDALDDAHIAVASAEAIAYTVEDIDD